MTPIIIYLIESATVMTFLYLVYKWLVARSTFHTFNRGVMLLIYLASWTLPLLLNLTAGVKTVDVEIGIPVPLTDGGESLPAVPATKTTDWPSVIQWIYLCGFSMATAFTMVAAARLWRLIAGGRKENRGDYTLVTNASAPSPLTWGRFIIVRPSDCDRNFPMVLAHELKHKSSGHWIDLILAQLTAILQWFSPAAWLMMRELRLVHEFQVDATVDPSQRVEYQMMLLKKTVGRSLPTLADSLNHSQIKLRITMMLTKKSNKVRRMTALTLPVAGAMALFVLSQPTIARTLKSLNPESGSEGKALSAGEITKNSPVYQIAGDNRAESAVTETMPIDETAVTGPESGKTIENEATEETATASPFLFVDNKPFNGSVNDIDSKDIASMEVVKNDPKYPQGKIMIFTRSGGLKAPQNTADRPYVNVEKTAEYKGGMKSLMDFMVSNIRYPKGVKIDKAERVIVQFEIGVDGNVSNARIMRGSSHQEFNDEALRIVRMTSGNWEPATNEGVPVATKYALPVTFKQK